MMDGLRDQHPHRLVALVEHVRGNRGVTIDPERELRQVVGADGKAVEKFRELGKQDDVARDLHHHVELEPVVCRARPCRASSAPTRRASSRVRQKGTMIFTLVSPISSRTRFSARHSSAKPAR